MSTRFLWFSLVLVPVILDRAQGGRRCSVTNCAVSNWSSWSDCTVACGLIGTQRRTRNVTRGANCGGSCPFALSQVQACNRWCYNGGTPQQTRCICKSGYSGQCCERGNC